MYLFPVYICSAQQFIFWLQQIKSLLDCCYIRVETVAEFTHVFFIPL